MKTGEKKPAVKYHINVSTSVDHLAEDPGGKMMNSIFSMSRVFY
jgi:hypothetical protein